MVGTWYNIVMEMADNTECQMCDITREIREFGIQAFDWDYLYELLDQEKKLVKY